MLNKSLIYSLLLISPFWANSQTIEDNFEGNGNIGNWQGDNCLIKIGFQNPFKTSTNSSDKVLEYKDNGGLYANVRFDLAKNLDLSKESILSLKIYIPSSGESAQTDPMEPEKHWGIFKTDRTPKLVLKK